jgi:hypothetical protein
MLKFDIECDNFNFYFARHLEGITEDQKTKIPKELNYKLFKGAGKYRAKAINKLGFMAKLFILIKCFRKRWILLVEEEETGMTPEQFFEMRDKVAKEGYTANAAENVMERGYFATANKELMDGMSRLNLVSVSPAYHYLARVKNIPPTKTWEFKKQINYVINFLSNYEGVKKKILLQANVPPPELYVLFYLYDGLEKGASSIYNDKYRYTYNASKGQIQRSFVTLQNKKWVEKIGNRKFTKLKITPLGAAAVDDIMRKYLIDF